MKYIICGIPNSNHGVGRLIGYLEKKIEKDKIITPFDKSVSLKKLLDEKKIITLIRELIIKKISRLCFNLKLNKLKGKELILIHPQTIGLKSAMRLISKNSVTIYVMDNSFFCRSSYNYMRSESNSCLKCLGGEYDQATKNHCTHPMIKKSEDYLLFYKFLMKNSSKIRFYSQNNQQTELIKLHFGKNVNVKEVGLVTKDILERPEKMNSKENNSNEYDIVYHASNALAKGLEYTIKLAEVTPHLKYLIPSKKSEVEKAIGEKIILKNIWFESMSWETGLAEAVKNAKMVLCPSLWSAPIEGAVVKSLKYNGNLAMINCDYSFAKDIPDDIILKLCGNVKKDKKLIEKHFNHIVNTKRNKKWINNQINLWIENYGSIFN